MTKSFSDGSLIPESSVSTFFVAFTFPSNMIVRHEVENEERATEVVHRFVTWLKSGRRTPSRVFLLTSLIPRSVVLNAEGAAVKPAFSSVLDASTAIEAVVLKRKRKVR